MITCRPLMRLVAVVTVIFVVLPGIANASDGGKSRATEVVATGMGTTLDEALSSAWQAAIRQTVGTLVDSTTVVENESLVQNEIVTFSKGFIRRYDIRKQQRTQLGFEVEIAAMVATHELENRLVDLGVRDMAVDGASLGAKLLTQMRSDDSCREQVNKIWSDYFGVYRAELAGEPTVRAVSDGHYELQVPIIFRMDEEAYDVFFDNASILLTEISDDVHETIIKPATWIASREMLSGHWDEMICDERSYLNDSRRSPLNDAQKSFLCADPLPPLDSGNEVIYLLPRQDWWLTQVGAEPPLARRGFQPLRARAFSLKSGCLNEIAEYSMLGSNGSNYFGRFLELTVRGLGLNGTPIFQSSFRPFFQHSDRVYYTDKNRRERTVKRVTNVGVSATFNNSDYFKRGPINAFGMRERHLEPGMLFYKNGRTPHFVTRVSFAFSARLNEEFADRLAEMEKIEVELVWDDPAPSWYVSSERPIWSYKIHIP